MRWCLQVHGWRRCLDRRNVTRKQRRQVLEHLTFHTDTHTIYYYIICTHTHAYVYIIIYIYIIIHTHTYYIYILTCVSQFSKHPPESEDMLMQPLLQPIGYSNHHCTEPVYWMVFMKWVRSTSHTWNEWEGNQQICEENQGYQSLIGKQCTIVNSCNWGM